MDYGNMLGESFSYAKTLYGASGSSGLLPSHTYIPADHGYMVRIYSGVKPAPETYNPVGMFIDGIKLIIIGLIYSIPIFVIMAIFLVPAIMVAGNGGDPTLAIGSMGIGLLLMFVVAIIISLIAAIGMIRFAQKDSMGQAFEFGAILEHIGRIGWGSYIIALIVLWIVGIIFSVIVSILGMIPVLGWLIGLFMYSVWYIFAARYMTLIYESAAAPA